MAAFDVFVVALLFLWTGANGKWAIVLLVFPHVYRYAKNLLVDNMASAHVLAARARGVSRTRILLAHVVRPVGPQLFAVAGVSASLAFGASIPVEVICDVPGIGRLVGQAPATPTPAGTPVTVAIRPESLSVAA